MGWGRRCHGGIERATGRTRKTIRRYKQRARKLGWQPGGEKEPDEELAVKVGQSLRPVSDAQGLGAIETRLMPQRPTITEWVSPGDGSQGLRLAKVHNLLVRQGVKVPCSSLHRFAVSYCGFRERQRITVRVACAGPGELAEVDYGRLGIVYDPETGRRRVAWALLVTLGHSRHQYVHVGFNQTIAEFIGALEDAWEYFGGVPKRVVLDNLKAAVTKTDRYESILQRTFDEYAAHRDFVIDAAVVRHAKGKPKVERNVQYVRENFFRGETWIDLDHVRREAVRRCTAVAGKRTDGTTRQQPLVVFIAAEQPALSPLKAQRFDPPTWQQCKVHPDHQSVPARRAREKLRAPGTWREMHRRRGLSQGTRAVRDLFSLGFVERHQDVIFLGPVGVGKTFLACALGHAACRAGNEVRFLRADHLRAVQPFGAAGERGEMRRSRSDIRLRALWAAGARVPGMRPRPALLPAGLR